MNARTLQIRASERKDCEACPIRRSVGLKYAEAFLKRS